MSGTLKTISPIDGAVIAERSIASATEIDRMLERAVAAQQNWRAVALEERAAICRRAVDSIVSRSDELAPEITVQMGRAVRDTPGEIAGFGLRSHYMIDVASRGLADVEPDERDGLKVFIRREPIGVVLAVSAWNGPYLIPAGSVIPGIMAGNAVVLKHSAQTPLCAERIADAFAGAGLPDSVFQYVHTSHENTERIVKDKRIGFVSFTGSVDGGRRVHAAAGERFINMGLELGGKDPAYVRPDANLAATLDSLIDGVLWNAGQSCCSVERIYAHEAVYDQVVEGLVERANAYRLGDPMNPETTLGPMVRAGAADFVRRQVGDAIQRGARGLVDSTRFPKSKEGTPYLEPQILVDVDHSMELMNEESFGPVAGIMKVSSDEQAIELMNDSIYGLTASIWTSDEDAALGIAERINTGTCMMNHADFVDPALAWTGVKDTGCGCSLSALGYQQLTRPKSFHIGSRLT